MQFHQILQNVLNFWPIQFFRSHKDNKQKLVAIFQCTLSVKLATLIIVT